MLIRALGYTKLPVPYTDDNNKSDNNNNSSDKTEEEPRNRFRKIIRVIKEFFDKLFGIKK